TLYSSAYPLRSILSEAFSGTKRSSRLLGIYHSKTRRSELSQTELVQSPLINPNKKGAPKRTNHPAIFGSAGN
ncbi:hypothetical protein, partial [Yersinia mollaretii]|uniref:hypothetical protein n=1 Tax=Yersinia mollaretii TaxID=33060 RepID=UPI001C0F9007